MKEARERRLDKGSGSAVNVINRRRHGFNLIEVMIALGIFAVGILAIMGVYPVILQANRSADSAITALNLAQPKLDSLLITGVFISTTAQTSSTPPYTLSWWGSADPGGNAMLQQINVKVSWPEGARTRNVQLESLLVQQ